MDEIAGHFNQSKWLKDDYDAMREYFIRGWREEEAKNQIMYMCNVCVQ